MSRSRLEKKVDQFYGRWCPHVFTFCRLYLGNRDLAEIATEEAFSRFLRQTPELDGDRLSPVLVRCAWEAVQSRCALRPTASAEVDELVDALPLLPCEERSVFIMRSVLNLRSDEVAVATRQTPEQVNQLLVRSLLRIRKLWLKRG